MFEAKLVKDSISVKFATSDKNAFINLLNDIKQIPGRQWEPNSRSWLLPFTEDNISILKKLGFNIDAEIKQKEDGLAIVSNAYKEIILPQSTDFLFPFQKVGVQFVVSKGGRAVIADDMGCIDGNAIVTYNQSGNSKKITLKQFYIKYKKNNWKLQNIKIRCLKDGRYGQYPVKDVLFKGIKKVNYIKTASGKELYLTPDHELFTNKWEQVSKLKKGDFIIVNGTDICKKCGSNKNIIIKKTSKYLGNCKKCMYELRTKNNYTANTKRKHRDGYIYLRGPRYWKHPRFSSSGLLEHIYVVEKKLKRSLMKGEEVHHKNKVRHDNRLSNLEVLSIKEHHLKHKTETHFKNFKHINGNEIVTIPKLEKIIEYKKEIGEKEVYDIKMEAPYHNFIANGILVHNCGKSAQGIGYLMTEPEFTLPALIVCPAVVKINWRKEILKFWKNPPTISVLSGGKSVCQTLSDIVIINYDLLSMHMIKTITESQRGKKITKYEPDGFLKSFSASKFKTIILDESHYIKSDKAKRYKACHYLASKIRHKIPMTGTPITNQPIDYWTTLNMLRPDLFGNKWQFGHRWCNVKKGWGGSVTFSGCKDPLGLNKLLKSTVMIRRLKSEVLKDLPPKIKTVIPIEIPALEMKKYHEKEEEIFEEFGNNPIVKFAKLLTQTWEMKKSYIFKWIDNVLENGEKLIVFAHHKIVIKEITQKYGEIAVKIDGSVSQQNRDIAVESFQTDKNIRMMVANHKAGGVGITLTASNITAFVELSLVPTDLKQAGDRNYRIGTKGTVNEYFLIADSTLETDIMDILDEKTKSADAVLDGIVTDEKQLLSALMKKYKQKFKKRG